MEQLTQYLNLISDVEWLMISVVFVLFASLLATKHQRKEHELNVLSMQSLQRDLRALANAAVGVGERVLKVERNQRKHPSATIVNHSSRDSLPEKNRPVPVEIYGTANQPYEQAINMSQSGASVNDIVNVCGLSKSEAELVNMMHRLDKAS